jgi:HK97 gp10 family phage protein
VSVTNPIEARVGLQSNRRRVIKANEKAADEAMDFIVRYMRREVARLLRQNVYPPAGPELTGPPAFRTGTLQRSIRSEVTTRGGVIRGRVGSTADYAAHLEMGTSKMRKRPFLRPSLDKTQQEAPRALAKAYRKRFRVTGRVV